MFNFNPIVGQHGFEVRHNNGVLVGLIEKTEDGFYQFFPENKPGAYWDATSLKLIAQELDRLNEPWNAEINAYFAAHKDP